ncbi:hypothetical protein HPP92_016748 [Vanilla planifolia]|uniref:Uncharacterized protein n=1 Tax=Vanilla planifolia TaxID=51239 RepID=A0A835UQD8_VANPL|nr:hypothetical protein HPP92_016748 [Vanilla planifolia]
MEVGFEGTSLSEGFRHPELRQLDDEGRTYTRRQAFHISLPTTVTAAPQQPTAASPAMFASFRHSYSVAYDGKRIQQNHLGGANACNLLFEANGRQRGKVDRSKTDADKLFEMGMIRPLKLPPRLYAPVMGERRSSLL